jgi:hypothetical protein
MKKNILFIVIALSIIASLYLVSRKQFVPIPADEQHIGVTVKEECLKCHGPGKISPLKKDHPPKDQCFECHKRAKKK